MNTSIKVSSPEGMVGFLSQVDPFQDEFAMGRTANWSLEQTGRLAVRFMTREDIKEGLQYILDCET